MIPAEKSLTVTRVCDACAMERHLGEMKFEILYCRPCGYRDRADTLADELRARFDAQVEVEEGMFGQFDVFMDDELVASKGGFWARKLRHGAPPQEKILAAIDRCLSSKLDRSEIGRRCASIR